MRYVHRCSRLALFVILALQFHLTHATLGQPGTIDLSWNVIGRVMTPIGSGNNQANAMVVQPDGKVLLAGHCYADIHANFCALRYNANGTLDMSWNGTGKVMTPVGGNYDLASAVALQPDGKVLLAGYCIDGLYFNFCSQRYNSDGSLDNSWNGTGTVMTRISSNDDEAIAIALQPDGKVLLAGYCSNGTNYDFCAVRYNADGTLDNNWNTTGTAITPVGTSHDQATAVAVQPDGKVLLAGRCLDGTTYDFCAVRFKTDGTLDTAWNGSGKVITPVGGDDDFASTVTLQSDGKVVVAGYCYNGELSDFCAVRYHSNGTLDSDWNGTGKVITRIGRRNDYGVDSVLQPDGKLILAGTCINGGNTDFCVARYDPHGALDASWSGTGTVITPVGNSFDQASAIALQSDGKVLVAGSCRNGTNDAFCALRYDGGPFVYKNCSPDIDGDGFIFATTDALIYTRVALGITGPAVTTGITFPPTATRNTWPLIRDYLVTQCGISLVQ